MSEAVASSARLPACSVASTPTRPPGTANTSAPRLQCTAGTEFHQRPWSMGTFEQKVGRSSDKFAPCPVAMIGGKEVIADRQTEGEHAARGLTLVGVRTEAAELLTQVLHAPVVDAAQALGDAVVALLREIVGHFHRPVFLDVDYPARYVGKDEVGWSVGYGVVAAPAPIAVAR